MATEKKYNTGSIYDIPADEWIPDPERAAETGDRRWRMTREERMLLEMDRRLYKANK